MKNKDLAEAHYSKIFMDVLSNCYDSITTDEADTYMSYQNPEDISCTSEHIAGLLNLIPSNYRGLETQEQMRPTPHQMALAQAYRVFALLIIMLENERGSRTRAEEKEEGRTRKSYHVRMEHRHDEH